MEQMAPRSVNLQALENLSNSLSDSKNVLDLFGATLMKSSSQKQ